MIEARGLSRPQLRRQLRAARRALSAQAQKKAAQQLDRRLATHLIFLRARHIALYWPSDGEIDPRPLMQRAWRLGKSVYLPVLKSWPKQQMVFQRLKAHEPLRPNRFRIPEPPRCMARQRPAWTLDVILMPLVGFDAQGGRLGMGGGFYDRCLAFLKRRKQPCRRPVLLGLAHECQRVDALPLAAWDIPLHATLTEASWYPASGPIA